MDGPAKERAARTLQKAGETSPKPGGHAAGGALNPKERFAEIIGKKSGSLTQKDGVAPPAADNDPAKKGGAAPGPKLPKDGPRGATIQGIPESLVKPYKGEFPAPLPVTWYVPKDVGELFQPWLPAPEIRGWIDDAAKYQGISPLFAAVILQQENGPNATTTQKIGQFGERSLTTFLAITDDALFDLVPDKLFDKRLGSGSSGIPNLARATLRTAANYSATTLKRPPLPDAVRYRIFGWAQDTRIPGDDIHADIYYQAAHIRELIDRVTGTTNFQGELSLDQVKRVFKAYNGSGAEAEKYSNDAMAKLQKAATGQGTMYFYQPREQK
jgi:hypothetical protein